MHDPVVGEQVSTDNPGSRRTASDKGSRRVGDERKGLAASADKVFRARKNSGRVDGLSLDDMVIQDCTDQRCVLGLRAELLNRREDVYPPRIVGVGLILLRMCGSTYLGAKMVTPLVASRAESALTLVSALVKAVRLNNSATWLIDPGGVRTLLTT